MKYKLWSGGALLLSLLLLSACTVKLVSHYDARTEESISDIRANLTTLFFELDEQVGIKPDCRYDNHSEKYKQLWVDLELMAMRERTKSKNEKTEAMVEVLDEALKKLQKLHKKDCLNRLQIKITNESLSRMLDSILRFEKAKSPSTSSSLLSRQ